MERYKYAPIVATLCFVVFSFAVFLSEIPLLSPTDLPIYMTSRILVWFASLGLCYWMYKKPYYQPPLILIGLAFALHICIGQYYRSIYFLSFLQLMIAYSFLYPIKKKNFLAVLTITTLSFVYIFFKTWDQFVIGVQSISKPDMIFAISSVVLIAFLSNYFFASDRGIREGVLRHLSHIGKQTAHVVHDLKGMTASQRIYMDLLKEKMKEQKDPETLVLVSNLVRDLEKFNSVIFEVNQLSAYRAKESNFDLREVIDGIQMILKNKLDGVQIEVMDSNLMQCNKAILTSIFLNLFLNSQAAFSKQGTVGPKIFISREKNALYLEDNAGGFPLDVLKRLQNSDFGAYDQEGSGLGLLLVSEGIRQMKGSIYFANSPRGARICLQLPSSCFQS